MYGEGMGDDLIERIRQAQGNDARVLESLVQMCEPLVRRWVRRYKNYCRFQQDYQDLRDAAWQGAQTGILKFDTNRFPPQAFWAYVNYWVRDAVQRLIRGWLKGCLRAPVGAVEVAVPDPEEMHWRSEARRVLMAVLACIERRNPLLAAVFLRHRRYMGSETFEAIGADLGVRPSLLRQQLRRFLQRRNRHRQSHGTPEDPGCLSCEIEREVIRLGWTIEGLIGVFWG